MRIQHDLIFGFFDERSFLLHRAITALGFMIISGYLIYMFEY